MIGEFSDLIMRPLENKVIVLTRAEEQLKDGLDEFSKYGASVFTFPTIDIIPSDNYEDFDKILFLEQIDYLIFTSSNTVRFFTERLKALNTSIEFGKIKVVAVGAKTKEKCLTNNIPVDFVPKVFSGEEIAAELSQKNLKDKTVFIPCSELSRDELPAALKRLGAIVHTVPVYKVTLPKNDILDKNISKLNSIKPDVFVFTSPSTFRNFLTIMKIKEPSVYFKNYKVAAIGTTTKTAIEDMNVEVDIVPVEFTIKGLAKQVAEYYSKTDLREKQD